MSDENEDDGVTYNTYDEEDDDFEVISQSDEEIEQDRSEISKMGLDNESDQAFTRLYNKSDQKEPKKKEKKPPPDLFMPK